MVRILNHYLIPAVDHSPMQDDTIVEISGAPSSGIAVQTAPSDLEAQEDCDRCIGNADCAVHDGLLTALIRGTLFIGRLRQIPMYQVFMAVATFIIIILSGTSGARSRN
jgi:hypothetical protein